MLGQTEIRIAIFGKTGQVARELVSGSWPKNYSIVYLGRAECDLSDLTAIADVVSRLRPDVVVNAAAFTAVDRAETEVELAGRVNRDAPAAMAQMCARTGATLIHLSTDYVFDGSKQGAYTEEDPIAPLSVYGRTKAAGEEAIRLSVRDHVILRTSWVFASHGTNFVRTVLRLAGERPQIGIVADQKGAPTAARDIAGAIVSIIHSIARGALIPGTFHFTSDEPTTWYGFAREILGQLGSAVDVLPITTEEYRTAAQRPVNSVLDCGRIARGYGIAQPSWRQALATVLTELGQSADASRGVPA